jgi:hypothetical protein
MVVICQDFSVAVLLEKIIQLDRDLDYGKDE